MPLLGGEREGSRGGRRVRETRGMEIRERALIDFCEYHPLLAIAARLSAHCPPGHSSEIILPIFWEDEGFFKLGIQSKAHRAASPFFQASAPIPALPAGTAACSPVLLLRHTANNKIKSQAWEPKATRKKMLRWQINYILWRRMGPAFTCPSPLLEGRKGGRERYPMSVAWGKRLCYLWDKHPPICFHRAEEVHACSHMGGGLACLLHAQNSCPSLLPAPGLVPEPPGQMAEEGEVLGQEQCDGWVRALRCHGASLHPAAWIHPQVCQGWHHGVLCPLAPG